RFPAPLRESLRDRLAPEALAWAVVHLEADDATQNLLLDFLPLPAEERDAWGKLQDLAVGVRADGATAVVEVQLRGRDAAATDQLGDTIERSLGATGVVLSERAKSGDWLRLAAKLDAEALGK